MLRASHNRLKHKYFSKKEKLGFYEIEPLWSSLVQNGARWSPQPSNDLAQAVPSDPLRPSKSLAEGHLNKVQAEESQGASEGAAKSMAAFLVAKKKYKIHPYLFNVICKFPRKYVYHSFGKDILRKYYTMPFRLNTSRFISNKVSRSYYSSISHKASLNLCQKAAKGRSIGLPHAARRGAGGLGETPMNFIVQKGTESAERAKNFIPCLEERLDSTSSRLPHFKPLNSFPSVKRALSLAGRRQKLEVNEREAKLTKYPKYQIKSPWSYFGAGRIRQLISHGHIQINGKKVKSPNTQIRPGDKIHVKGFIVNPETPPTSKTHDLGRDMRMNHLFTLLLRRSKDQAYLSLLDTIDRQSPGDARAAEGGSDESLRKPKESSEEALCNYIAALKIKRFTEAFHTTYRNLHSIERTSSLGVASALREGATRADDHPSGEDFDVEKHVQPVSETIGYNQSIYLSWPVISLLKASLRNSQIKRNPIQSSTRAPRPSSRVGLAGTNRNEAATRSREAAQHNIKRKLQNLLKRKKLQTSGVYLQNRQTGSLESSIPNRIRSLTPQNPSRSYTAPSKGEHARGSGPHFAGNAVSDKSPAASAKSSRSYASIVYGTRKCKWIKLQQGSCGAKGSLHNQIPNHTQSFQLELEFPQAVYRGVHGHS